MGLSVCLVDLYRDMKIGSVCFVERNWVLRCNDMNLRFHLHIRRIWRHSELVISSSPVLRAEVLLSAMYLPS